MQVKEHLPATSSVNYFKSNTNESYHSKMRATVHGQNLATIMKKTLLLLASISLTSCLSQNKQNIDGKWYLINKSGFVEFTITKDSLFNEKLFPNFSSKRDWKTAIAIPKRVILKDRILLIGENPKNPSQFYTVMTLVQSEDGESMKYIWNGIDSISTIEEITKLNESDNRQLLGYDLYTKEHLEALKEMKSIDEMNLHDFKNYLKIYFQHLKASEYGKNLKGYYGEASSFNYQTGISSLLEMGYNPIQTSNSMNSLFAKFIEKDEVKEFMKKLKEK